jgi:hypothetical protein
MEPTLEIQARAHPDPRVQRLGFDLTHPYVEQCWGAVLGPSGVAILRRLPTLWAEHEPALIASADLGASLGLTDRTGDHSRLGRALRRLDRFRLGEWLDPGRVLAVYTVVAPLTESQMRRVSDWTRSAHNRLLDDHLAELAGKRDPGGAVSDIAARLDLLQETRATQLDPDQALGR